MTIKILTIIVEVISCGKKASGRRRILNIESETKAFCASNTLLESINMKVAKLAIAT